FREDEKMANISKFELLPTEIRLEIFKNLNHGSLFSCLLVERRLCHEIVPILWENPFRNDKRKQIDFFNQSIKVVDIYVRSFSQETWKLLNANGINRPSITLSSTFNYASFLRCYDAERVSRAADEWLNLSDPVIRTQEEKTKSRILKKSLCQLFETEMTSIKSLNCVLEMDDGIKFLKKLTLKTLSELKITKIRREQNLQNLFEYLTEVTHLIRGISIGFIDDDWNDDLSTPETSAVTEELTNTAQGINDLIEVQSKLAWLKLCSLPKVVCETINFSNSLQAIFFCNIDFNRYESRNLIHRISSCENLRGLEFYRCRKLEQQSLIEAAQFLKRLEYLSICLRCNEEFPRKFIIQVIQASGHNFQYLNLYPQYYTPVDIQMAKNLVRTIISNSPNIRGVNLPTFDASIFIPLLKSSKWLEHLGCGSKSLIEAFGILNERLPPTLYSLLVDTSRLGFSDEVLHQFLASNHRRLKHLIARGIYDSHVKLAKQYAVKLNNLSTLNFSEYAIYEGIYPNYFNKW
ncbi:2703_t:CDS:2, partial [Ambispora leptoticha]